MADITINPTNNIGDLSFNVTPAPANIPAAAPAPAAGNEPQQQKQPSIYGEMPSIPTQDAVEGIKFDFNDGIRILFPHNGREYQSEYSQEIRFGGW